jgi:hypothetical protein
MVPRIIRRQLGRLRRREDLLRLTWGLARWLAVAFVLLALACLADWLIDFYADTPWPVRVALLTVQVVASVAAVLFFLVLPLSRRQGDTELALRVEEHAPELGHRLISAVQLNQPDAATAGMSPELIGLVTRDAEVRAARLRFTGVADHRRLKWSACLAVPVFLAAALFALAWPETVEALLRRQLLADEPIPRSVYLASVLPEVWYRPSNEEVVLRFHATGPGVDDAGEGVVLVEAAGQYPRVVTLEREGGGRGEARYVARVPAATVDFTYRAWLADGRTRGASEVRYVPRPAVNELTAWVRLPKYVGLRPSGEPFEKDAPHAEIASLKGGSARVRAALSRPVREAAVEVLAYEAGQDKLLRRVPLILRGEVAAGTFDLLPGDTAYRVVVADEHGFVNVPPPRRGIRFIAEEPPTVTLLREEFPAVGQLAGLRGPAEDFEMDGVPLPAGGPFRIAYVCTGPYGLDHTVVRFRVLKKSAAGEESEAFVAGKWHTLPLKEKKASREAGPFDPRRGVFLRSGLNEQVEFHAVDAVHPEKLGRTLGGGRFDLRSSGIPDDKGDLVVLRSGDQLEYFVEVFAGKDSDSGRPSARSETRRKSVVSAVELVRWLQDVLQEERRIKQLETKQRGVFEAN